MGCKIKAEEASRTDSLTGLPNRRGFIEATDGALVRSRRSGRPVSALAMEHEGRGVKMTLSLGVAEHLPGRSIEETIAQADAALYQAKEEGRNRVVVR